MKRLIQLSLLITAFLAVLSYAAISPASSTPHLQLRHDQGRYPLEPHLEILEDPSGKLAINDVASQKLSDNFRPLDEDGVALGITRSAYWLRFRVQEEPIGDTFKDSLRKRDCWILEIGKPWLDKIDLFIPVEGGDIFAGNTHYIVTRAGDSRPRRADQLLGRTFSLRFPSQFKQGTYFFIRLESVTSLTMPLTMWSESAFRDHISRGSFRFGLIFGVMAAMILFNLFICVSLRDRIYLLYVLFIAGMLSYLLCAYGHIKDLIAPLPPELVSTMFLTMLGATYFFAFAFSKKFLDTKTNAPRMDKLLSILMLASLSLIFLGSLNRQYLSNIIAHSLGLIGPLVLLGAGGMSLLRGFRPAIYFLIAWFVLLFGSILYALSGFGLLPHSQISFHSIAVGAALESVLLSFAMADRINGLRKEKEKLVTSERRYQRLSYTDGLTGLYNKRFLMSKLISEMAHAKRMEGPLSVAMIDVDDFKKFNDVFGHQEGDKVLRALGHVIMTSIRDQDVGCRYGGEEFTVILPRIDVEEALKVAERIRDQFGRIVFRPLNGPRVSSTVSIGISQLNGDDHAEELLRRADKALYKAKESGKNKVVSAN